MLLLNNRAVNNGVMPSGQTTILTGVGYSLIDSTSTWFAEANVGTDVLIEVTDPALIDRLKMLVHTIHTDGTVRLYGSGLDWLGEPITGDDLAKFLQAAKYISKLNAAAAANKRYKVMSSYDTMFEQSTWGQQLAEALAVVSTSTAATPLLTQLAAVRDITVADYAQRVINANANYTAAQNALLVELKLEYQKIDSAATAQELKDIGWLI
jgi:hypothetical protein